MAIRIEPYTTMEQAAGVPAFNERMRAHGQSEFWIGEQPPAPDPAESSIQTHNYIVLDEEGVRGGLLLADFPASFGAGEPVTVINCREPLSEAIIDSRFAMVGLRLLKFMEKQGPYLFALGMGGEHRPFPRLLKSAGWSVSAVPFLFRVGRASAFLRELRMLQTSPAKRVLARAAALTGAGKLGVGVLQLRSVTASWASRGFSLARVSAWDSWVDELWEKCRVDISFSVRRDLRTVRDLYALDRVRAYCIHKDGQPVAWISVQASKMQDHQYFGNLRVSTILDGIALPGAMRAAVSLASGAEIQDGAELLVTNQSHTSWIQAFKSAGYLSGPSNYILAISKKLAADVGTRTDRLHFTRGDADGRCHL